ncbi:LTV1-like protein [Striga asiatica]|uniref:LTV1-like protein n=1 Tax=Striga asiatica TaxID=4170 RepID=A0A5A7RIR6_STRAF|nr:LTV1-like protein [Striga asiatica]
MGRKKKFIDKKKSATFQLMARDTSDPNYSPDPSGDRVFVRVDDNDYAPESFNEGGPDGNHLTSNPDSIFADAPEDSDDDDYVTKNFGGVQNRKAQTNALPDHVRKEILELGFPDDGYNYLAHLREIKNTGGGSTYYQNPKADFVQLPRDVKAYDASRVEISKINDVSEEKSIYNVASKTFGVRLQKVVDPDVAAMLEDGASSKYASDIEDLEEDFVVCANLLDGPAGEENDEKLIFAAGSNSDHVKSRDLGASGAKEGERNVSALDSEKPRVRRPLDEHFDLLELQEYGADSEEEEEEEYDRYMDDEDNNQEILTEKLNSAFKDCPSGLLRLGGAVEENEPPEPTPEVIQRCREYAEKYENDDNDLEEVLVEESSDESEVWDCETIVTTYSTLDNHPGKIGAPEARRRKKKLADELLSGASVDPTRAVIALKGKEKLPVDFLPPRGKKQQGEKTKDERDVSEKRGDVLKQKPRCQESKEEKKERKSAVKLERREARLMKKEMKGLYKSEAHRAQKVAAFTGPSSIHLM